MAFTSIVVSIGLLCLIVSSHHSVALPTGSTAETGPASTSDPKQCAQELINWCNNQQYSFSGQSIIMNTNYNKGVGFAYTCITTGSSGTECKINNEPWFQCTGNHTLTFKGKPVSTDSNDSDICKPMGVLNKTKFDEKAFEQSMSAFNRQMQAFQRQMSRVFGPGFPFNNGGGDNRYRYNIGVDDDDSSDVDSYDEP